MDKFNLSNFAPQPISTENVLDNILEGFKEVPTTNLEINRNIFPTTTQQSISWDKAFDRLPQFSNIHSGNIKSVFERIAKEQTGLELTGKVAMRTFLGEIIGGTVESIGALDPNKLISRIFDMDDAWERNTLEQIGNDLKEWTNDRYMIYLTENAKENLALGDKTFWANLIPSVASYISIIIPSMMASKGIQLISKGVNAARLTAMSKAALTSSKLNKVDANLVQLSNLIRNQQLTGWQAAGRLAQTNMMLQTPSHWIYNVFAPALVSRNLDSTREALNHYTNTYDEIFEITKDEDFAKKIASESSHSGYLLSHANIAFDIVSWTMFSKMRNLMNPILSKNLKQSLLQKSEIQTLFGSEAGKLLGKEALIKTIGKNLGQQIFIVGLSEGFDEMTMDFFMNEGKVITKDKYNLDFDDSNVLERIGKHIGKAKNWESFIGGFLGGITAGGLMKGSSFIRSKLDSSYKDSVDNLATTITERLTKLKDQLQTIDKNINEGDTLSSILNYKEMLETILVESASTGTLSFDIEMLKNLSNLSASQLKELGFIENESSQEALQIIKNLHNELSEYANIFHSEMAKTNIVDNNINNAYNIRIASIKTSNMFLQKQLDRINTENSDITDETLRLQSIESIKNNITDNTDAIITYEELRTINTEINKIKDRSALLNALQILNSQKISALKNSIEELKKDENHNPYDINNKELSLLILENENKDLSKKIEEENNKLKIHESEKDSILNKEETSKYKDILLSILNKETENLESIRNNDRSYSFRKILESTISAHKEALEKYETSEGRNTYKESYEKKYKILKDGYINEFTVELEKVNEESKIKELLEQYLLKNQLGHEVKTEITKLAQNKIDSIKKEDIEAKTRTTSADSVVNSETPTNETTEETITPSETVTEQVIISPPTRDYTEVSSVNKNGFLIKIGEVIKYNGSIYTVENIYIKDGNTYVKLKGINEDISLSEITPIIPFNKLQLTQLQSEILENSDKVKKDENGKLYIELYDVANDKTIRIYRDYRISNIDEKITDESKSQNKHTISGTNIDTLTRDFFELIDSNPLEKIDNKDDTNPILSKYKMSAVAYNKWIDRLIQLNDYFTNILKARIFATGVKVFDPVSKIGGELDLLLIDNKNNIYVFDLKSITITEKTTSFANKDTINTYLKQVNAYAAILQKQYKHIQGVNIAGVGFVLVGKKLDGKGKILDIIDLQDKHIKANDLESIYKIHDTNSSIEVLPDYGIVNMSYNPNLLKSVVIDINGKNYNLIEVLDLNVEYIPVKNQEEVIDIVNRIIDTVQQDNVTFEFSGGDVLTPFLKSIFYVSEDGSLHIDNNFEQIYYLLKQSLPNLKSDTIVDYINEIFNAVQSSTLKEMSIGYGNHTVGTALTAIKQPIIEFIISNYVLYQMNNNLYSRYINPTNEQLINLRTNIINIIQEIRNSKIDSQDAFMSNISSRISLLNLLLSYKTAISDDTDLGKFDIKDIAKLLYHVYLADESSFSMTAEEAYDIVSILPTMLSSIYTTLNNEIKFLWSTIKSKMDTGGYNFNNETYTITNLEGEEVAWTEQDIKDKFDTLLELKNRIVIKNNFISKSEVLSLIDEIKQEITFKNNNLLSKVELAAENLPNEDNIAENSEVIEALHSINKKSEVLLKKDVNGTISVYLQTQGKEILLSSIPNLSRTNKSSTMTDYDGNFIGFNENFIQALQQLLLLNNNDNTELIEYLKEINKNKLLILSNNISNKDKNNASKKLKNVVSAINNPITENDKLFAEIIRLFLNNNLNKADIKDSAIGLQNTTDILDILFYNKYLMQYDNYTFTSKDLLYRVNKYNKDIAIQFKNYKDISSKLKTESVKGFIRNIGNPSVAIDNSDTVLPLKYSIKPISIKGETPKVHLAVNNRLKGNTLNLSDDSTVIIDDESINMSNKNDLLYVLLEGIGGRIIPFRTTQSTVENSYGNEGYKATRHLANAVVKMLNSATTAGREGEESLRNTLFTLIEESDIYNLVIFNKDKNIPLTESTFKYFTVYYNKAKDGSGELEVIIEYTSFVKDGNNTIEVYNKFVARNDEVKYYSYEYNSKELSKNHSIDKVSELVTNNIKKLHSSDSELLIKTFKLSENNETLNKVLSSGNSSVGNTLRQAYVSDIGILDFIDASTRKAKGGKPHTDPVTGKTYSNATEYVLDTDAVYARVKPTYKENSDGELEIISNLDFDSTVKARVDVGVENVTEFNPNLNTDITPVIKEKISTNAALSEIFTIIDYIDTELKLDFKDKQIDTSNVEELFTYLELKEKEIILSQIKAKVVEDKLQIIQGFSNALLARASNFDLNNSVLALIHEHIHKVILLSAYTSKLSTEDKISIIEQHNFLLSEFVNNFKESLNKFLYRNNKLILDNANKINEIFGFLDIKTSLSYVNGILDLITKEINDKKTLIETIKTTPNYIINGTEISQELYAYMSNPFFMAVLAIVPSDIKYESTRKGNNFIDKLINFIVSIYSKIVRFFQDGKIASLQEGELIYNVPNNYFSMAKDMLADLYDAFTNNYIPDSKFTMNQTKETAEDIDIIEETEVDIDLGFEETNESENPFSDTINEQNSIIILPQNTIKFKDDSNFEIC